MSAATASASLHDRITACAYDLYGKLIGNNTIKFNNNNEYTILASFIGVHHRNADNIDDELHVLSLGTGTKCAPQVLVDNDKHGYILPDSHAEIIARRAFIRYLIDSATCLIDDFNTGNDTFDKYTCPIELIRDVQCEYMYRIKSNWSIHLYISDSPCGDAAIYANATGTSSFTGAKQINGVQREDTQMIGTLRTKSGRSDVKEENKTKSHCCSDKICRWLYLGLQGSLLTLLIQPIYLTSIVIGRNPIARSVEAQMDALTACIHRGRHDLSSISYCIDTHVTSIPENVIGIGKNDATLSYVSAGNSTNWIRTATSNTATVNISNNVMKRKFIQCSDGTVEITIASTGGRQGCTKSNLGTSSSSSRLCKNNIALLFGTLLLQLYDTVIHTNCSSGSSSCSCSISTGVDSIIFNNLNNILCHICSVDIHRVADGGDVPVSPCRLQLEKMLSTQAITYWKALSNSYNCRKKQFLSVHPYSDWVADTSYDFYPLAVYTVDSHNGNKGSFNGNGNKRMKSSI